MTMIKCLCMIKESRMAWILTFLVYLPSALSACGIFSHPFLWHFLFLPLLHFSSSSSSQCILEMDSISPGRQSRFLRGFGRDNRGVAQRRSSPFSFRHVIFLAFFALHRQFQVIPGSYLHGSSFGYHANAGFLHALQCHLPRLHRRSHRLWNSA